MSKASFENDSLGWQANQLSQIITEWWELQTTQIIDSVPDLAIPNWLDSVIVKILFVILLSIVLYRFSLQTIKLVYPYFWGLKQRLNNSANPLQKTSEKKLILSYTQWLQKASKFQQDGNYYQACRCLYLGMLQQLNDRQIVLHQWSRTDGEYKKLIQTISHPQPYEQIFNIHQQLCFGNLEATLSQFKQCEQAYNQIKENEI